MRYGMTKPYYYCIELQKARAKMKMNKQKNTEEEIKMKKKGKRLCKLLRINNKLNEKCFY